jgi:hypothetical protein
MGKRYVRVVINCSTVHQNHGIDLLVYLPTLLTIPARLPCFRPVSTVFLWIIRLITSYTYLFIS